MDFFHNPAATFFTETMVFSSEEKAVIKNDFTEKEWSAFRTCKEHPTKKWNKISVQRLLNRFKNMNQWIEDLVQENLEPQHRKKTKR